MMMKENYKKLVKASESYRLNSEENLTSNLLDYIQKRVIANKQQIEELLSKNEISFKQLEEAIRDESEEKSHYKDYTTIAISQDGFLSTALKMPVGIIAVEVYDTLEVIKYYIKAIKSKNAIAISDIEYNEYNVKSLILLIIKEALKKFGIDENLIMLLPYEECFYKYFDEVLYTHDENGEKLSQIKIEKKDNSENLYVYLENEELKQEAEKNENAKILKGDINEVIEQINCSGGKGAVIYTKDSTIAYKFINIVKCDNVFVNTNLVNIKEKKKCSDFWYEYRNIIIPMPSEMFEKVTEENETVQERNELTIVQNESILDKMKNWLKKLFK